MSETSTIRPGNYSPEEDAVVLKLFLEGKRNGQIGAAIGRSAKSVSTRLTTIRPARFKRPMGRHQYTADDDLTILTRRNAGDGFKEIGEDMALSPGQVRDRYTILTRGGGTDDRTEDRTYQAFEPLHDAYVQRCIEQGGFIYREVVDGAVLTFNWRGAVIHEVPLPRRVAA